MDNLTVSQAELADVFGVTTRTIQRWEDDGLDDARIGEDATYDLPRAVAWSHERIRAAHRSPEAEGIALELDRARLRKWRAEARSKEIAVAKEERELMPVALFKEFVGTILDHLRQAILSFPARWGDHFLGLETRRGVDAALRPVVREFLTHLSVDVADSIERGEDPPTGPPLPEDFPGRSALVAAGVETWQELRSVEDLQEIRGIGPKTAARIIEALEARNGS